MLGEVPAGYQQIITISLVKNCLILFNFYFFLPHAVKVVFVCGVFLCCFLNIVLVKLRYRCMYSSIFGWICHQ